MGYRERMTEDYEFEVEKNEKGGYEVSLPHQCDDWKILGYDGYGYDGTPDELTHEGLPNDGQKYPAHPTDKNIAIKQMELFVKRAQEALEKLKNLP